MLNIITKEVPINEELKERIEYACKFASTTPKIINGSVRYIDYSYILLLTFIKSDITWYYHKMITIFLAFIDKKKI